MNITYYFFKNEVWNKLIPQAKSKENIKEVTLLSNFLSEVDLDFSKDILKKLKEKSHLLNLSSESWQVIFDNDVEISFLYDENNPEYKVKINREIFKKAIVEWHKFLQLDASVREVTISLST